MPKTGLFCRGLDRGSELHPDETGTYASLLLAEARGLPLHLVSPGSVRGRARDPWRGHVASALTASALLTACVGIVGDPATGLEATNASPLQVVAVRFPRLSHPQWEQTVVDLFHLDAPTGLSASFSPDPDGNRPFDNNEAELEVTPALWNDYQTAAEAIAEQVTSSAEQLARFLPDSTSSRLADKEAAFLRIFGQRVYRRPLSASELDARRTLFDRAPELYPDLDPFVAGVRASVVAFLQSPFFIYRAELSQEPTAMGSPIGPLGDWEIASRLSYAIWNTMPDDELFRAAAAGELATAAGAHAQISRMISAPRTRVTVRRFFDQLYGGDRYAGLNKNPTLYPDFTPTIAADMRAELGKFTGNVYEQGGGVRELLTSTTTFVTPGLSAIYGVTPPGASVQDADGFVQVQLDPTKRAGLLTLSGFLGWKGTASQPNTIQRGVFINRKIICQPLPSPPPQAQGKTLGDQKTDRERVDALTGPGTCGAGCHGIYINGPGFALEHYGAMGEYRAFDGDTPVDSSGTFSFAEGPVAFTDAIDLSETLARSPQVHACFSDYLVQYVVGRDTAPADAAVVEELAGRSAAGASTRDLLISLLESDLTRYPLAITESP
jgi:hypothetical protein